MQQIKRFFIWVKDKFRQQKLIGKLVFVLAGFLLMCCVCSVPVALLNPADKTPSPEKTSVANLAADTAPAKENAPVESEPTSTIVSPTKTPRPTSTPRPTKTPLPPTATPDPNLFQPGTYLVGTDIRPGIYRGMASGTEIFDSCYWGRMKDVSGEMDSILANDNAEGQFYVEVLESDKAFKTACELIFLEKLPEPASEFPMKIAPGMYLVGIDIKPGTYKGQAGTDILESCYWGRLTDVTGGMNSIITNDNAAGQYYVQVGASDFALKTACELEWAGE